MTTIQNIYEPYNFAANPCYIIGVPVEQAGYLKIEHKLPDFVKNLSGIFVSVTCRNSASKVAGILMLNFNEQLTKCFQRAIIRTNFHPNMDHSKPFEFDETILPNSYMQGFFFDQVNLPFEYPYTLTIYLHYKLQR